MLIGRRLAASALLSALAWLPSGPARAAGEGRATAQTIGITDGTSSAIPGFVWGGNRRCDPTDSACTQGGRLKGDQQVERALPVPAKPFSTSERVSLDLSLSGQPVGSIELGLWRDQAPASVDAFVKLAGGRLAPRPGDAPASLERSTLVLISKDKAIVLGALREVGGQTQLVRGQTRPVLFPVSPPSNDDSNAIKHDMAGLLSVRRGGGSFTFTLTPRPNPELDRDEIVIGQVLTPEGMQVLARLNALATNNYNRGALAKVVVERARVLPAGG